MVLKFNHTGPNYIPVDSNYPGKSNKAAYKLIAQQKLFNKAIKDTSKSIQNLSNTINANKWISVSAKNDEITAEFPDGQLFTFRRMAVIYTSHEYKTQSVIVYFRLSPKHDNLLLATSVQLTDEFLASMDVVDVRHSIIKALTKKIATTHSDIKIESEQIFRLLYQFLSMPGIPGGDLSVNYINNPGFVADYSVNSNKFYSAPATNHYKVEQDSRKLPGVMDARLLCPVKEHNTNEHFCSYQKPELLWRLIQHINDQSEWTRENIADWLDELADDGKINIDFSVPDDIEEESVQPSDWNGWKDLGYVVQDGSGNVIKEFEG